MDLGKLDTNAAANDGAEIELRHPSTGEGLGVFVTALGSDSDTYRKFVRVELNRRQREQQRRGGKAQLDTIEDQEEWARELVVACTKSWRTEERMKNDKGESVVDAAKSGPFILFGDEKLQCTPANARRLYEARSWVVDQLSLEIREPENFTPG